MKALSYFSTKLWNTWSIIKIFLFSKWPHIRACPLWEISATTDQDTKADIRVRGRPTKHILRTQRFYTQTWPFICQKHCSSHSAWLFYPNYTWDLHGTRSRKMITFLWNPSPSLYSTNCVHLWFSTYIWLHPSLFLYFVYCILDLNTSFFFRLAKCL